MFKKTLIPFILILSFSINAQKKELKEVDKLVKIEDYDTALKQLLSLESVVNGSDIKYQAQYQLLAGKIYSGQKNFKAAFAAFESVNQLEAENGSSKHTMEINKLIDDLSIEVVNKAIAESDNENHTEASDLFILAYNLDKTKYIDYLYYAAATAVNGRDYDSALTYYLELKDLNYTGSVEKFYATENESGEEVELSEENYVFLQKLKSHSNFRSEMTESRLPEIIKNIALIYVEQKRNDLAISAIKDARAVNPLDIPLILTEANLYIQLGDKKKFIELTKEAIAKDPNNHTLYFNLGVVTSEQGDINQARSYYEKAIELDPTYTSAYNNLALLIMDTRQPVFDEMSNLSRLESNSSKYKKLELKLISIYKDAVSVLEALLQINPSDLNTVKTLKNIFETLEDPVNKKKYEEKLKALEQ
jgi:tetratricopeptide (TPR) repeat protein